MKQIFIVMGHNPKAKYSYPIACFENKTKAQSFMRYYSEYDNENDNEFDTIWIHQSVILK